MKQKMIDETNFINHLKNTIQLVDFKRLIFENCTFYQLLLSIMPLKELIAQKGKPEYVRCDNGPEFISRALEKFAVVNGIEIRFSQPGKPTQNGLVERLNGTQCAGYLNLKYFKTVQEVRQDLDIWWNSYNFDIPHSALGYLTPQQFIDKN